MSFLESITSELLKGSSKDSVSDFNIEGIAKTLLSSQGGGSGTLLDTVVGSLKEKGLAEQLSSWIGKGENASVTPEQLKSVLGEDIISKITETTGMSADQVYGQIASLLPVIINQLTPEGKETGESSLVQSGMSLLKGFL